MRRGQAPRIPAFPGEVQDVLASLIKERMKERNLSGSRLAKLASIDQGSLSKALARKINLSSSMLDNIALALGENPQRLYNQALSMAAVGGTVKKLPSSQVAQLDTAIIVAELMLLVEHLSSAKRVCQLLLAMVARLENASETVQAKDNPVEIVDSSTS